MVTNESRGSILLYQTDDGASRIEVTLSHDTVWLTADQMATLFQRNKSTISRHIRNVLESGELKVDSTVAFFATVQKEGAHKQERNVIYKGDVFGSLLQEAGHYALLNQTTIQQMVVLENVESRQSLEL